MSIIHSDYEVQILENTVYRVSRIRTTNVAPALHVTGTGNVDIRGSLQTPASINDPILTLEPEDTARIGFVIFQEAVPNFIKVEPNVAGTRVLTLSGFEVEEVIF